MAPMAAPPAGAYKLDKSHASLVLRANHMGFSTYTTRFSRFDADLTLDPRNLSASKVVTTIDASSFEMDAAPQMCLDIMKGPQMLDTAKFPQIVFKSEAIRMTGAKSMEISGTLTLHGVTRPTVLVATYNGGYAGMPKMDPQARVGFSARGSFKRSDFGAAGNAGRSGALRGFPVQLRAVTGLDGHSLLYGDVVACNRLERHIGGDLAGLDGNLVQMPQLVRVSHHIDCCDLVVFDFERGRREFTIGFHCDEPGQAVDETKTNEFRVILMEQGRQLLV
jgi:polyisoprenoid-binding protein YceI